VKDNLSPFAAKWFWRALLAKNYLGSGGIESKPGYTILTHARDDDDPKSAEIFDEVPPVYTMHGGKGRGRLIGGNLSVMHAMMGTPFEIETAGKILFIEDVGEAPYRVDRMLQTLRMAGKFDHAAGVILGQFTAREEESKWDDDASVDDVLRDFFGKLNVPVLTHFPIGHVRYNTTLPEGAMAELDADAQTVQILENPVTLL
jgi:muramoyltetrapeptide carboxypeptidase